jgi:hypothetical protein
MTNEDARIWVLEALALAAAVAGVGVAIALAWVVLG